MPPLSASTSTATPTRHPDAHLHHDHPRADLLRALVRDHHRFLLALAHRVVGHDGDADDLVHDVLMKAVRAFDRVPLDHARAWLTTVLRHAHVDRLRHRARVRTDGLDDERLPAPPHDAAAWWAELGTDDVRAALAALPTELRAPFELYAFDGASYDEIAARLAVPRGTVGTRILRARRRLRRELEARRPAGA